MAEQRSGDWILTATGRQFWPLDPAPEDVCIEDIAHSLALQCRFTGHCLEYYSVAEHCARVSRIVPPEDALWALLHDASEAYLTDLARPLKRHSGLGREYQWIEMQLMDVICERFGLPCEEPPSVKRADDVLLMTEKRDLMAHCAQKWVETAEPLPDVIIPWSWDGAKSEFLLRFYELTQPVATEEACLTAHT